MMMTGITMNCDQITGFFFKTNKKKTQFGMIPSKLFLVGISGIEIAGSLLFSDRK